MKNLFFALAFAGLTLAGCAEEPAETTEPIIDDAEVVTEPADDMMMETDSTMMEEGDMMADSTMMEADPMMADTTAM